MTTKDFNVQLKDLDGKPMKDGDRVFTAKDMIRDALWMHADQAATGEEKFKQHNLAIRIAEGATDYEPEELALIKKTVAAYYRAPLVVGQIFDLVN